MAKQPKNALAAQASDEPTVGEGETAAEVVVEIVPTEPAVEVAVVEPVVVPVEQSPVVPFFVTSMNNGTLAEANAKARAEQVEEQKAITEAREAAYALVNKMFGGVAPIHVLDAVFHNKVR